MYKNIYKYEIPLLFPKTNNLTTLIINEIKIEGIAMYLIITASWRSEKYIKNIVGSKMTPRRLLNSEILKMYSTDKLAELKIKNKTFDNKYFIQYKAITPSINNKNKPELFTILGLNCSIK